MGYFASSKLNRISLEIPTFKVPIDTINDWRKRNREKPTRLKKCHATYEDKVAIVSK